MSHIQTIFLFESIPNIWGSLSYSLSTWSIAAAAATRKYLLIKAPSLPNSTANHIRQLKRIQFLLNMKLVVLLLLAVVGVALVHSAQIPISGPGLKKCQPNASLVCVPSFCNGQICTADCRFLCVCNRDHIEDSQGNCVMSANWVSLQQSNAIRLYIWMFSNFIYFFLSFSRFIEYQQFADIPSPMIFSRHIVANQRE